MLNKRKYAIVKENLIKICIEKKSERRIWISIKEAMKN
jgi:coenzyme F420-reducing hydrogenase delta subunit